MAHLVSYYGWHTYLCNSSLVRLFIVSVVAGIPYPAKILSKLKCKHVYISIYYLYLFKNKRNKINMGTMFQEQVLVVVQKRITALQEIQVHPTNKLDLVKCIIWGLDWRQECVTASSSVGLILVWVFSSKLPNKSPFRESLEGGYPVFAPCT